MAVLRRCLLLLRALELLLVLWLSPSAAASEHRAARAELSGVPVVALAPASIASAARAAGVAAPVQAAFALQALLPAAAMAGPVAGPQAQRATSAARSSLAELTALGAAASQGEAVEPALRAAFFGQRLDAWLDTLNPFSLAASKLFGVSHRRLAPPGFFSQPGPGQVVGVNAVGPGQMYRDAADHMSGAAAGARQVSVESPEELISALRDAHSAGGPIGRLVLAAHGRPGMVMVGSERMSGLWALQNKRLLDSLPQDLFLPGAVVVLVCCKTAYGMLFSGGAGVRSLKQLFAPLLRQGGTVRASTRYVDPELGQIPAGYKNWGDRIWRHLLSPMILAAGLVDWLFADWPSKWRKIVDIAVAPSPQAARGSPPRAGGSAGSRGSGAKA